MEQIKLSRLLKVITIICGIFGTGVYFVFFPIWGQRIADVTPELAYSYWPWLILIWLTSIPCYAGLVCFYKISHEIGLDNSFSAKNAKLLKCISYLSISDGVFFFIGNVVYLFLNINHPAVVLVSFVIACATCVLSVLAACLSHLVYKAAKIEEENQLTI